MTTPPLTTHSIIADAASPSTSDAKKKKCCPLRKSRKGCMKGKGGPDNPLCPYRGVRQRTWGKWVAEIRKPNRGARLWLGTFNTVDEAAQANDTAACALYGDCARLNISPNPVSSQVYPEPPTMDVDQNTPSPGTGSSSGGCYLDTLDQYVMGLPRAEDFGLSGYEDIINADVNGFGCNVDDQLQLDGLDAYDHWFWDI